MEEEEEEEDEVRGRVQREEKEILTYNHLLCKMFQLALFILTFNDDAQLCNFARANLTNTIQETNFLRIICPVIFPPSRPG